MLELLAASATRLAALIRSGQVSSREVMRLHLERAAETQPYLNAVVCWREEEALRAASEADEHQARGGALGPLHGVPFSVKDSLETAGTRCTAGTLGLAAAAPSTADATLVARLRQAGAILAVKTNLPDLLFAYESDNCLFGRTNNPYDLTRTAGGSSGGEAALIAAGGSPLGLGSDAAGSVRIPAHFCGIASIKPTSGRLPRTGHFPPAGGWIETLWQIGPMARYVEDLQTVMPLLAGPDGLDRTVLPVPYRDAETIDLRGLRMAFYLDNGIQTPTPAVRQVVRQAVQSLCWHGVQATEERPPSIEESYDLEMAFLGVEGDTGLRRYLHSLGSARVHPLLDGWLNRLPSYATDIAGFAAFWERLDKFRDVLHRWMQAYDVIVCPVFTDAAVPHGASIQDDVFPGFSYTMAYNLTGWPAAIVRCGTSAEGLPLGVQIVAPPWREDVALAVARQLEQDCGGWQAP